MSTTRSEELVDVTNNKAMMNGSTSSDGVITTGGHERPPKPVPFGSSDAAAPTAAASTVNPRENLRKEVHRRRMSLTPQEHGFLAHLAIHGNEIEVELAREKLCDENLFFETSTCDASIGSEITAGWGDDICLGREGGSVREDSIWSLPETQDLSSMLSSAIPLKRSVGSDPPLPATRRGSVKLQEHLEARRNSVLFNKMWKAHESGLAVTRMGSQRHLVKKRRASIANPGDRSRNSERRRSELIRSNSILSAATKELLLDGGPAHRPGEDNIFRGEGINAIPKPQTGSMRATSSDSSLPRHARSRSVSWSRPEGVDRSKLPPMRRPSLLRNKSEGSRKSVTFKRDEELHEINDIPGRVVDAERRESTSSQISDLGMKDPFSSSSSSIPSDSFARLAPIRSESMSSIPSIHHAHPIRSDSMSSIPSIPSIHHAHPIRSDSMSSIPSLHHAHPLRSDSIPSIPSLHHGHPIRTESNVSSLISPVTSEGSTYDYRTVNEILEKANEPAWKAPLPSKDDLKEDKKQLLLPPDQKPASPQKPVLYRMASRSNDDGQGIEVSELDSTVSDNTDVIETLSTAREFGSIISFGDTTNGSNNLSSAASFDDMAFRNNIFREIRPALSDENLSSLFLGSSKSLLQDSLRSNDRRDSLRSSGLRQEERDESWDMDDSDNDDGPYDAWEVLKNEHTVGYGSTIPFIILGTSGDDEAATPHVLSPPLMESLQNFLPYGISEDNFWMKYSLLRDGASMHTLLQRVRGARYTIIALETWDGEVFGSFTSEPWRKNWNYFGTGEAFLWRMRQSRKTFCTSIIDQAHMESELDVFPWTGDNHCVQLCTTARIAVGGGEADFHKESKEDGTEKETPEYGFGLTIDSELLHGTSTHCVTFGSPPLSKEHADGSPFEIINLEVWTLTPCMRLEDAEKLELGKLFLESK